ncbi:uncharacterized protein LOC124897653 isoform X2 [Capsicum annuum]|uniref:uncharacterized protein LOC124897653 isoform X2 n=1 Tax=Capsicum annuum TaxID=4072 RepID=UPI001FB16C1A|nr:uncharacterized protein LOC124897653 isoform X2 [Capsicum annuum]
MKLPVIRASPLGYLQPQAMDLLVEALSYPLILLLVRELFFFVCRKIFNPRSGLFAASPNNRRRFLPNRENRYKQAIVTTKFLSGRGKESYG